MSYRALAAKMARIGFDVAKDIPVHVTYHAHLSADYDQVAGAPRAVTADHTWHGVLSRYESREIDGRAVTPGDVKLTGLQAELPATPGGDDTVTIKGVNWEVVTIGEDSAGATWILQLRRAR